MQFYSTEKQIWQPESDCIRTEAIAGALPVGQNSPQSPAYGLYAEKFSGTAFTVPRAENQHTWTYRILPSAVHSNYGPYKADTVSLADGVNGYGNRVDGFAVNGAAEAKHVARPKTSSSLKNLQMTPDQTLFEPFDIDRTADWVTGQRHMAGAGDPSLKTGLSIYHFSAGKSMPANQAYYSADGDLLIVLEQGVMDVQTELGKLIVRVNEILLMPRGIRYRVDLPSGPIRGFSLELFQGHFQLPELGFLGSNGLANARDFQAPVACYKEDTTSEWLVVSRFAGELFQYKQNHTPFDVVAWHGQYYPYKYDLNRYNAVGSISFDHIDPSIYTVLTAPSPSPGTAIADFVVFPPRWLVQEHTFRPPWYHRNTMAEFTGMISADIPIGTEVKGLRPGGIHLHNVMTSHGPDAKLFEHALIQELIPERDGDNMKMFMFETSLMLGLSTWAMDESRKLRPTYQEEKWHPLGPRFQLPKHSE